MKRLNLWVLAAILLCGIMNAQAQVMKTADLEKYAKQRYGDKWVDAAANIASRITLDKNEGITFQEVIEAPGKTKEKLYIALNYWATATFKDHNAITLNDKEAGCIIISSTIKDIAEHTGTLNKYRRTMGDCTPLPLRTERRAEAHLRQGPGNDPRLFKRRHRQDRRSREAWHRRQRRRRLVN